MAEYVNREEIKEAIHCSGDELLFIAGKTFINFEIVEKAVLDTPAADVVEVKHGYWKWEKKIEPQAQNRLYCSVCDNECLGKGNYYVKSDYCPHCFSRMDGTPQKEG